MLILFHNFIKTMLILFKDYHFHDYLKKLQTLLKLKMITVLHRPWFCLTLT